MFVRYPLAVLLFFISSHSLAHHSFAVHFVPEGLVEITGIVDSFRFSNPHGVLTFTQTLPDGTTAEWRAETNSPNVLRRRGWSRDSIKPGEEVTVTGYPARDGTPYMRIEKVVFADGRELVGQARSAPAEEKD
jgi:hypothetical protein